MSFFPARTSKSLLVLLLVALATTAVYWPALNGQPIWDDDAHITKPELRSWHGMERIWVELGATQQYYPLLHSAFWIEHRLWGDAPLGYHLANLLQHLASTFLVWLILRRLNIPGALLAAAIFAIHPVQVESVAWITEQKNTLSALFYLSALLIYLGFDQSRQPGSYILALALFVCGLLTKTVTATLPGALLVIFWWQRGRLDWRRDLLPLIPWFIFGLIAGLFTAWVERSYIGAQGAAYELSVAQRLLIAGRVPWFYLANLFWPARLIFIYPRWEIDPAVFWQWLFPLATLALTLALWMLRKKVRAPLAGWLYFLGTLLPVLGFFNVFPFVFSFVADHFQYLASLGIIVPVAAGLSLGAERLAQSFFPKQPRTAADSHRQPPVWLSVAPALLLIPLAVVSWNQSRTYADAITLYQSTIQRNPGCWMAYNNLGVSLADQKQSQEAIRHYHTAIELKPDFPQAHNNLAAALADIGQFDQAIDECKEALRLRPNYAEAYGNLGMVLDGAGKPQEAKQPLEEAVRVLPNSAKAQYSLATVLAKLGQLPEAIKHAQQAIEIDPDYAEAHNTLGIALTMAGRVPEALNHFKRAVQLQPSDALTHDNFGKALSKSGRTDEAIQQYLESTRLAPDYADAWFDLAVAYAAANRPTDVVSAAQKASQFARAQQQSEFADQIDAWLANYRNGH